ncbi:unnamed protein product, partial [Medioppia subpectinata]
MKTMAKRGALVVLEGVDRVGKSTQALRLSEALKTMSCPTHLVRFPNRLTPIGQMISQYLKGGQQLDDRVIHLLFSANRWEMREQLEQLLSSGTSVIADRYVYSGVAYSAAKPSLDLEWCRLADRGLPKPDSVLYLTASEDSIAAREGFGDERYETKAFQQKVRNNYEKLKEDYWETISADKSEDELHKELLDSVLKTIERCLAVWFHEHSHLLKEKDCISMLLEVIELGISGSKSKKNGFVFKADKQLKPASMRVREAAESLLTLLMNHFNNCPPSPCPPESIIGSSLIDESNLLKYMSIGNNWTHESACDRFKYFVSDNLIMLAVLDQLEPNSKQTVCIIRSPFGKYCWTFAFKQLSKKHKKTLSDQVSRPLPKPDITSTTNTHQIRHFPESMDKIKLTK